MKIYVQFADSKQTSIVSYFTGPQDKTVFRNQGEIETDDTRWKAFFDSLPPAAQRGLPPPTSP